MTDPQRRIRSPKLHALRDRSVVPPGSDGMASSTARILLGESKPKIQITNEQHMRQQRKRREVDLSLRSCQHALRQTPMSGVFLHLPPSRVRGWLRPPQSNLRVRRKSATAVAPNRSREEGPRAVREEEDDERRQVAGGPRVAVRLRRRLRDDGDAESWGLSRARPRYDQHAGEDKRGLRLDASAVDPCLD